MNERIKLLAEQAEQYAYIHDGIRIPILNPEKFAELIVRECVNTVNKRYMGDNNREDMEVRCCVEDLKKHFGVE